MRRKKALFPTRPAQSPIRHPQSKSMLGQVIELIEKHDRFAITSHIRPDGDSLGSSLALGWILRGLKKEAEVITCDQVPHAYVKLPGAELVRTVPDIDREYDAVFVIECSDVTRPGLPSLKDQFVVNIDHHSTTALFGDLNWIDSTAAAVGEMIYNLAKAIGAKITPEIASCVYAALLTDTGSFHFSNTTERTFKIASELVRHGAQPAKLSQAIFYNYPYAKIRLVGDVLSTLRRDESGRIAWITMSKEAMAQSGASEEDSDGIISYPLTVGDVEAVAFFRELPNSTYRISLRSKNRVNVARVAEGFGGGGHANAAGFTIKADYEELSRNVIEKLKEAVAAAPAVNGREIKPR
jgi:bifunctional oligoribonuclease and PAP phosphatase NrnA